MKRRTDPSIQMTRTLDKWSKNTICRCRSPSAYLPALFKTIYRFCENTLEKGYQTTQFSSGASKGKRIHVKIFEKLFKPLLLSTVRRICVFRGRRCKLDSVCTPTAYVKWLDSQAVRQRSAKSPFPGSNPGRASIDYPVWWVYL